MIHIFYRVCDKVDSVNGLKRPFNLSKKQVIFSCYESLLKSLSGVDFSLNIIGDSLSKEIVDKLSELSIQFKTKVKWHLQENLGNNGSLQYCYDLASNQEANENDLFYFCEDDYLHDFTTFALKINSFLEFLNEAKFALPIFIHPSDYPDQYTRLLGRNYIFQTNTGYWREVNSTTCTFMTFTKTFKYFSNHLKQCGVDDGLLSKMFKVNALCFSPLPGIATHMHEGVMSNYVDWQSKL